MHCSLLFHLQFFITDICKEWVCISFSCLHSVITRQKYETRIFPLGRAPHPILHHNQSLGEVKD